MSLKLFWILKKKTKFIDTVKKNTPFVLLVIYFIFVLIFLWSKGEIKTLLFSACLYSILKSILILTYV